MFLVGREIPYLTHRIWMPNGGFSALLTFIPTRPPSCGYMTVTSLESGRSFRAPNGAPALNKGCHIGPGEVFNLAVPPLRPAIPPSVKSGIPAFGRHAAVNELAYAVNRHRFLAVLGAFGGGKSFVIRALGRPHVRRCERAWAANLPGRRTAGRATSCRGSRSPLGRHLRPVAPIACAPVGVPPPRGQYIVCANQPHRRGPPFPTFRRQARGPSGAHPRQPRPPRGRAQYY